MGFPVRRFFTPNVHVSRVERGLIASLDIGEVVFGIGLQEYVRDEAVLFPFAFCDDLKMPCELSYREKTDADLADQFAAAWAPGLVAWHCHAHRRSESSSLRTSPDMFNQIGESLKRHSVAVV